MTQINPKYLLLIERVKEKYPELRELVEELKPGCIYKNINGLVDAIQTNDSRINELIKKSLNPKIIGQLDLYILSKALGNYNIIDGKLYKTKTSTNPGCNHTWDDCGCKDVIDFEFILKLPHGNISEYSDELLDTLYNLI